MAFNTTIKHALRWTTGATNVSDIDAGFQALAEDIDGLMSTADSGLLSARPPSSPGTQGKVGRWYYVTSGPAAGLAFFDYGTGWAPAGIAIGGGFDWYGTGDPCAELMICDNRAISRATYATLFGLLGETFGAGNGSTTFNLPSTADRALVGVSGTIARGATGGAQTHTLTDAEIPGTLVEGLSRAAVRNDAAHVNVLIDVSPASGPLGNPRIDGGGGAHNNMPPYLGAYKVIRVL